MTPHINRSSIRKLALACSQQRTKKFSRVSEDFYQAINSAVAVAVQNRVANHPSVGKTLY